MQHELKVRTEFFKPLISRQKKFEIRRADRNFAVGDKLYLREWSRNPVGYTGEVCLCRVTHILTRKDFEIVADGYVMLSVELLSWSCEEEGG